MPTFTSLNARDRVHLGEGLREMYAGVRELQTVPDRIAALLARLVVVLSSSPSDPADQTDPGLKLAA